MTEPTGLEFEAHPPERQDRMEFAAASGSCCCCCCCLHSIGSLAGAVGGSLPKGPGGAGTGKVVAAYWIALLVIVAAFLAEAAFSNGGEALMVLALALPLCQLGASVVALIAASLIPDLDRKAALRRVGGITGYSVLLSLAGLGGMLALVPLLSL